jgi:hypothetical protein
VNFTLWASAVLQMINSSVFSEIVQLGQTRGLFECWKQSKVIAESKLSVDEASSIFWQRLKSQILPLRPSQYDLTSICNLTCEGCLFFSGSDYLKHKDVDNIEIVNKFFEAEAARGVRYGYFGGAEPSLVEEKLVAAFSHIPYGVVFTNGTRTISREIKYRIHVSVWGLPERSRILRGADMLSKQIKNYKNDNRAVFVFTITQQNLEDLPYIAEICRDNGLKLTFNHYSPTEKYQSYMSGVEGGDKYHNLSGDEGALILDDAALHKSNELIGNLMAQFPNTILYSSELNDLINNPLGLYSEIKDGVATDCASTLTSALRHHNTDLQRSVAKCCSPNIDCKSCRLYAQSFATILTRATREMRHANGSVKLIKYWQLWCAIFLNDDINRIQKTEALPSYS